MRHRAASTGSGSAAISGGMGVIVSIISLPLLWYAVFAGWLNWLIFICILGTIVSTAVLLIGIVGHVLIRWAQHS